MGLNKVFIMGNLGADPELRYTPSQSAVCNLRVATNERYKNSSGEWVEKTEWHSVSVFGKTAENCSQFLSKGRQVFVEGRLQTSKWQDKEGKDRYRTDIIASNVQFIGGRGDSTSSSMPIEKSSTSNKNEGAFAGQSDSDASMGQSFSQPVALDDDDIPF